MKSSHIVKKYLVKDFVVMFKDEISSLLNESDPKKLIFVNNIARVFLEYKEETYWRVIWKRIIDYHKKHNFQ